MRTRRMNGWRATITALLAGTLGATGLAVLVPQVASADITLPADPAWVTNVSQGVNRDDGFKVKALVKMGNTIYVGGSFTQIAPNNDAFAPAGTNSSGIDQPYLFAMDATTGGVFGSFQPKLNGSVEALEVGPPGSNTLYVGGTFTSVNGSLQNGLAVLDATTGALRTDVNQQSLTNSGAPGSVWALRLVGTKLYVGGNFTTVDTCGAFDCNRGQAARFDIGTMNLDSWQIYVQGGKVQAFAVDPTRADTSCTSAASSAAPAATPCGGLCDSTYALPRRLQLDDRRALAGLAPDPAQRRSLPPAGGSRPRGVGRRGVRRRGRWWWPVQRDQRRHLQDPGVQDLQHRRRRPDARALCGPVQRVRRWTLHQDREPGQPGQQPLPDVLDLDRPAPPTASGRSRTSPTAATTGRSP